VSYDLALEAVGRIEALERRLAFLHENRAHDRAAIGRANAQLGVQMKLAEVHATLAISDAIGDALAALDAVDPMPAGLPDRVLSVVRDDPFAGASPVKVAAHVCTYVYEDGVSTCHAPAVVFPPPLCAEHGGLEVTP
jgi:hypothetical protein